ncbi:MAG: ABC transporter ATP-binding protein [Ruminococcus sp.]|nr:ABC transporter ATP-binding protein [Ruminococcus sp.]
MSGRLENDSLKLLELKLNLEGNMADKIQNAYETSKNISDDVLTQRNIFSKLYIKLFWSGTAVFTENKWISLKNAHMNSTMVEYIEGIEVIKAFGRAGTSYEKYAKAILDYKKFVVKWLSSTWITMKMTFALFPSTLLGTLPVGLYLTMHGQLTILDVN